MVIELTIITDISKQLPDGKYKIIAKDVRITRSFYSDKVTYTQYVDTKGKVIKKYSTIIYDGEYIKVDHPLDEVKRRLGHYEITGYAGYAKYNKNKKV